jgi:hypothetical protein
MARDEDSDALISISPRDLTKVALRLEREADEKAARRYPRASTEPLSNPSEEEQRIRKLEDDLLELTGKSGTNGKIGNLRADVDVLRGFIKYIATGVVGSLLTAAAAVYWAGHKDGTEEREAEYLRAEVASLKAEVREMRAQLPAYRPSPWRPQGVDP